LLLLLLSPLAPPLKQPFALLLLLLFCGSLPAPEAAAALGAGCLVGRGLCGRSAVQTLLCDASASSLHNAAQLNHIIICN
jgi:hypothetical protein